MIDIKKIDIHKILPHRYPFLLIDRVQEYVPGERVVCLKNVTINESFFQGHFPGNPVMPGVLVIEAAAQAGIVLFYFKDLELKVVQREYLLSSVKASFLKAVVPGDQLLLVVQPVRMVAEAAVLKVECLVGTETVAKCDFVVSAKVKKN